MSMTRTDRARATARGNRWGLALLGALLAAAGAAALAAGLGAFGGRVSGTTPAGGAAAVGAVGVWPPYAAAVLAVVAALLALRWLLVQGRSDTVDRLALDPVTPGGGTAGAGTTRMAAGAARGAFEDEVGDYPGVRHARARMTESEHAPRVRLDLTLDDDADVPAVWRRVRAEALENLRTTLELDRLPAVVRLSMSAPPKGRRREPV
jgi:hypothetical protein